MAIVCLFPRLSSLPFQCYSQQHSRATRYSPGAFNIFWPLFVLLVSLAKAARLIIWNAFFASPPRGGGGSPFYRLCRYVPRQRYGFLAVWSEIGYQFRPFWSEIGYGLCTLVLNWVCFLEELATSSSFGDKTFPLLMFTPTTVYLP